MTLPFDEETDVVTDSRTRRATLRTACLGLPRAVATQRRMISATSKPQGYREPRASKR